MADRAPATPAAWRLLQIVAGLAAPLLLAAGAWLAPWIERQTPRGDGTAGPFVLAVFVAWSAWSLAVAVTAYRRMAVARWLGGAFILVLILLGLVVLAFCVNDAAGAVWIAGAALLVACECSWLYAFALSARARHYLALVIR